MLHGGSAQEGWDRLVRRYPTLPQDRGLEVIRTYHPSTQAFRHRGFEGALKWAYDPQEWEYQHLTASETGPEFWARTDSKSRRFQERIRATDQAEEREYELKAMADAERVGPRKKSQKDPRIGAPILSLDFSIVPQGPPSSEG